MDLGADGCEVDLRRTADGVLVLFHDDMLAHLTTMTGKIRGLTYAELLILPLRDPLGRTTDYRIPTDTKSVAGVLSRPGRILLVDDPRVAAGLLQRPSTSPSSLPAGLPAAKSR